MKRIIDGVRYDTEKAEEIANWSNGLSYNDFNFCDETLYRTKNDRWFIVAEGGARSKWSKAVAGGRTGGKHLVAMTEDEAYQWLENFDKVHEIEEYFNDRIVDA